MESVWLRILLTCLVGAISGCVADPILAGVGIGDMTGLASEGVLYGYANPNQDARGLHLRQYSRAFIFEDQGRRLVVVVGEVAMFSQALRDEVMEALAEIYGDLYTYDNVMFSPTHSHSTPGGYHTYWMYQVPTGGWVEDTVRLNVEGIVRSVQMAHDDMRLANIYVNSGELLDASINRSPYAYYNNPDEEIESYEYDVDKEMVVLKIVDLDEIEMGMISFFPVHTTSMKNYNHLLSTDNKGYAALKFEELKNPGTLPGQVSIIGAFAQTAEGDASPNINDARCEGTDELCYYNTSTCPEDLQNPTLCTGRGPAGEMFEDTRIIGERQYLKAVELYDSAVTEMNGGVEYRHTWLNMSDVYLGEDELGNEMRTCRPSMGYSFAAGATDGPGIPPFYQGDTEGKIVVDEIIGRVFNMSEELIDCQYPKPILLPTGEIEVPWTWQPEVIPLQLFQIGDAILIGVPAEVTTMAGRRLKNIVREVLINNGYPDTIVPIIIAMANCFTSYVTTLEEYQMQRYEGASNTYGQYTLDAYMTVFSQLAEAMANGEEVDPGEAPPDYRGYPPNALGPLLADMAPDGFQVGDVLEDVDEFYHQGEVASVVFVSGNPRHNMRIDDTFLAVERLDEDEWDIEYTDAHWETKFWWDSSCHDVVMVNRTNCHIEQYSNATIEWEIPEAQQPGIYRISHFGHFRDSEGVVSPYTATSSEFQVQPGTNHGRVVQSRRGAGHKQWITDLFDLVFL